jgi:hypothetical protein
MKVGVDFFGHTVTQDPKNPYRLVTFEKWGRRGALVDLRDPTPLATVRTPEKQIFFGHAGYVSDGSTLVTTEDNYEHTSGYIGLRDPSNLKLIEKMSSYGAGPHECRVLDDGKTLLVVNVGQKKADPAIPSNLCWIEAASGKLLHKITFSNIQPIPQYAHINISSDGWICAHGFRYSKDNPEVFGGCATMISPEGRVLDLDLPLIAGVARDEALSSAFIEDKDLVATTLPNCNLAIIWDYKTQKRVALVNTWTPKGILTDLKDPAFIVSSGIKRDLVRLSVTKDDNVSVGKLSDSGFGGFGSHMLRIYV